MFTTILKQEWQHWLRQPLPYFFATLLFLLSFVSMWGMASEGSSGPNAVMINSYARINSITNYFSLLILFILPAIIGVSIFRDYKSRMYTLLYSYPIEKWEYLSAKFISAFSVVFAVVAMIGLGIILGLLMPGVKQDLLLDFDIEVYTQLYGWFILPNMLLFGALIFAIVIYTRNIYLAFISVILLVILQRTLGSVFTGSELRIWASLLDPIGETAVKNTIRYWTLEERNTLAIPIEGPLLYNRLLWLGISLGILALSYRKFQFAQFASNANSSKKAAAKEPQTFFKTNIDVSRPGVTYDFSVRQGLKTIWQLSQTDFRYLVLSWPFVTILLAGFLMVYFQQDQMNPEYGFKILPTTANMLRVPMFIFTLVINLLTFLYMGVLMYRARLNRMDALLDSVPQSDWVILLSRLLAILKMQFVLLSLVILGGILAQSINGYYRYEIGHYLYEVYVLQFIHFAIWASLALMLHSVAKNLYLGFFLLLMVPSLVLILPEIGNQTGLHFLQESVILFNQVPGIYIGFDYSDLNAYGSVLPLYFAFKAYWLMGAALLVLVGVFAWQRGLTFSLGERLSLAKERLSRPIAIISTLLVVAFIVSGSSLYYQEHHVSKTAYTQDDEDQVLAQNEKRYFQYLHTPQPRIAKVDLKVDLFPESRDFLAEGQMHFVNRIDKAIDTIIVASSFKEITELRLMAPHQHLIHDAELHYDVYVLNEPLRQGDSLALQLNIRNHPNSLLHNNSRVLHNGTYLSGKILPVLGVRNVSLRSAKKRAKYKLPNRKSPQYLPSDSSLLGYEFVDNNMDRIQYECILSTTLDQKAFSMGSLIDSWTENNRNYFHYRSQGDITNAISWLSGQYEQQSSSVDGIQIDVYHHPEHHQNIQHLLSGAKASIAYCNQWFGQLEHEKLSLIEFPISEGTHATIQGNLIPYSESLFLCDIDDAQNEVFNVPYYTSAHEIAHFWWGQRVNPANIAGGKLITESVAEYVALSVLEQAYGPEQVQNHRRKMHDLYLQARASQGNEKPLFTAALEQDYLNYQKGSIILYALSKLVGEEVFNAQLGKYEAAQRFSKPPYPSSIGFVEIIRQIVPDSLQYLVKDGFESITLYDNQIESVEVTALPNAQFEVVVDLQLQKYRANAAGKEIYSDNGRDSLSVGDIHSLVLNDYLELGFYGVDGQLRVQTFRAAAIQSEVRVVLDEQPQEIILDPRYLFVDQDRKDNTWQTPNESLMQ
ncbi:MAG: M1 family aminopeptidase [Bacteroidia bacterium]